MYHLDRRCTDTFVRIGLVLPSTTRQLISDILTKYTPVTIAYGTRTLATLYEIAGPAELSSMSNSVEHHVHPLSQFSQDAKMQNAMESTDDDDTANISYWTGSLAHGFDDPDLKDNDAISDWRGDESKDDTFIDLLLETDDDDPPCLDPPPLLEEPIASPTPSSPNKNQAAVIIPLSSDTVFTSQSHISQQRGADAQRPRIKKVHRFASGPYFCTDISLQPLEQNREQWFSDNVVTIFGHHVCYSSRAATPDQRYDFLPPAILDFVGCLLQVSSERIRCKQYIEGVFGCLLAPPDCTAWLLPILRNRHWYLAVIDWSDYSVQLCDGFNTRGKIHDAIAQEVLVLLRIAARLLILPDIQWLIKHDQVCCLGQLFPHILISFSDRSGSTMPSIVVPG